MKTAINLTLLWPTESLDSEADLIATSIALGAESVSGWSAQEARLAKKASYIDPAFLASLRDEIRAGEDPLGEAFCRIRQPQERRSQGATYTPKTIVDSMVRWAAECHTPDRIVDPGTGSG